MSFDSIGNFLTIIRNAIARAKKLATVKYSVIKHKIVEVLKEEGFIKDFSILNEGVDKKLIIYFKYMENESVIHEINQISKPGRRIYVDVSSIPTVIGGLGIAIMTTNKGVITNKKAKNIKTGGEIICTVW